MKKNNCMYCEAELSKDIKALNKKFLGRNIQQFMCVTCLADFMGCSEEDLLIKIEEFKEQGCTLFL
ncbi:hypothetical protein [Sporomusa acidovorans]|uniref:Inhibitor of sigma-G Gin n=1 Tax=Sporomusa acidovorans (strain ATCC 49682 / DSM 3132 / Mol) TaxID=1123286 RepID=A0ABZ3J249_SPOA4|nr:hypothetical protein [Sporomusa acidovorans]OZC13669.1 hypothetical protein SPACI_56500 [Sporomusa acidovorans DSM 3132]SDE85714.1 hypothetical protein SAMN04488499_10242 [Sporomusa acidovorans]